MSIKKLIIAFLLFFTSITVHAKSMSITGTIVGIETGDYVHFVLQTKKGEYDALLGNVKITVNGKKVNPKGYIEDYLEQFKGKKAIIKVKKIKETQYSGGRMMDLITHIDIKD